MQSFGRNTSILKFKFNFLSNWSEQYKDISIEVTNGIKVTLVNTCKPPQIANLDGLKVKFYQKRLNHAVLNYYTDSAQVGKYK
jgi:hypothetical protein